MNKIYVAVDGNEIGKIIEKYLFCENLEELSRFSSTMNKSVNEIGLYIEKCGGVLVMSGGDNILACLPVDSYLLVKEYIRNYNGNDFFNFSIGVSQYPLGSYMALKYAKLNHLYSVKFDNGKFVEC